MVSSFSGIRFLLLSRIDRGNTSAAGSFGWPKSIKDRDFALRYAPALDCVGLNLLHQYFHKGRFNSGAFGPASFLRSEARSASAELSSAA
jgi:hypothetical protein